MPTHYEALGIQKHASSAEIKRAFRKVVLLNHPDKTGHLLDAERAACDLKTKNANNAWEVLRDEDSRRRYDHIQGLSAPFPIPRPRPSNGRSAFKRKWPDGSDDESEFAKPPQETRFEKPRPAPPPPRKENDEPPWTWKSNCQREHPSYSDTDDEEIDKEKSTQHEKSQTKTEKRRRNHDDDDEEEEAQSQQEEPQSKKPKHDHQAHVESESEGGGEDAEVDDIEKMK